jgi:hypothetical protein
VAASVSNAPASRSRKADCRRCKRRSGGSFGGRAFYRRRDEFYRSHAHRPVYWGTSIDPYYDRYDVCVFHYHHHDHVFVGDGVGDGVDDGSDQDMAASSDG